MKDLTLAAAAGNLSEVERLLAAGADVHARDNNALRSATRGGHLAVVGQLLDAGADVHADNDLALRWAAENGHLAVVERLLAAGADVHANDDYALCWAAENGHVEVLECLLNATRGSLDEQSFARLRKAATPAALEMLNAYAASLTVLQASGSNSECAKFEELRL